MAIQDVVLIGNDMVQRLKVLESYCERYSVDLDQAYVFLIEPHAKWQKGDLGNEMQHIGRESRVIIYSPADIVCSITQFIEFWQELAALNVTLHIIKSDQIFNDIRLPPEDYLSAYRWMLRDFHSKKSTIAYERRKAKGLLVGRPKGVKNKIRKLDQHKEIIIKCLNENMSVSSIAKLIGSTKQTLYAYVKELKQQGLITDQNTKEKGKR